MPDGPFERILRPLAHPHPGGPQASAQPRPRLHARGADAPPPAGRSRAHPFPMGYRRAAHRRPTRNATGPTTPPPTTNSPPRPKPRKTPNTSASPNPPRRPTTSRARCAASWRSMAWPAAKCLTSAPAAATCRTSPPTTPASTSPPPRAAFSTRNSCSAPLPPCPSPTANSTAPGPSGCSNTSPIPKLRWPRFAVCSSPAAS